ncbi:carboxymuconolactone decarboxylase family protein [Wukongibacter sp. M2B1]|uniref:carboxymuconolactone decarboxylase family protein n=1 Tax=Wukongibacter sp. M2B1 TaxID=3088895 RepID=UPI003D7B3FD1
MKQTNPEKIKRSQQLLENLKELRGGTILESHRKMANDPNLVNAFMQQYSICNNTDIQIPKKYRELIIMAIGMATGTDLTMKVHAKLAQENSASIDEICEVIRIIFFTCGVSKLIPAIEMLEALEENQ